MLGPFRIRNLRRPASPSNSYSPGNPSKLSSHEAVVCLTGREYNSNALRNPETRLKYLDDDDGEIVTVGTSVELIQRLQEPVPRYIRKASIGQPQHPMTSADTPNLPLRPTTPEMHLFEIDRRGESVKIWEEIEQRTQQQRLAKHDISELRAVTKEYLENRSSSEHLTSNAMLRKMGEDTNRALAEDSMCVQTDPSDDVRQPQAVLEQHKLLQGRIFSNMKQREDAHRMHFRASNPPQISQKNTDNVKPTSTQYHYSVPSLETEITSAKEDPSIIDSFHEGNLTTEGKRQAMEAGIQLRARTNPIRHSKSARELKSVASGKNRWASYGASKPFIVDKPIAQSDLAPETNSKPKMNESHGSLLEVFQAELSKISKPSNSNVDDVGTTSTIQSSSQAPGVETASNSTLKDLEFPFGVDNGQLLVTTAKHLIEGFQSLISNFREQYSKAEKKRLATLASSDRPSERLEQAIQFILLEADQRMQDATKTCQEAVKFRQRVYEKPCNTDIHSLRAVLKSFGEATDAISNMAIKMTSVAETANGDGAIHNLPVAPAKPSRIDDMAEWLVKIGPLPNWITSDLIKEELLSLGNQDLCTDPSNQIKTVYIPPVSEGESRIAHCEIIGSRKVVNTLDHFSGGRWGSCRASASMLSPTTSPFQTRGRSRLVKPNASRSSEQPYKPTFPSIDPEIPGSSVTTTTKGRPYQSLVFPELPSDDDAHKKHTADDRASRRTADFLEKRTPFVRFVDPPIVPAKRYVGPSAIPEGKLLRNEPTITYRHIPSPMPHESLNNQRGPQLPKTPARLSIEKTEHRRTDPLSPAEMYTLYQRRSMPSLNYGYRSRSRSRSPAARGKPENFTSKPFYCDFGPPKSTTYTQHENEGSREQHVNKPANAGNWRSHGPVSLRPNPAIPKSSMKVPNNSLVGAHTPVAQAPTSSVKHLDLSGTTNSTSVKPEYSGPRLRRWRSHYPVMNEGIRSRHARHQSPHNLQREHISSIENPALRHSFSVGAIRKPRTTTGLGSSSIRPLISGEPYITSNDFFEEGYVPTELHISKEINKSIAPALSLESAESSIAATRFPTLEQFEGRSNIEMPRFPPLPSMEALTPLRFTSSKSEEKEPLIQVSTPDRVESEKSKSPIIPQQAPLHRDNGTEVKESSGDFFKRMTGLNVSPETSSVPVSPAHVSNPSASGARLISPFDPLAETASIHRHQIIDGVHRSNTVAGSGEAWTARHRRPYSEYFSGNGRVEWESFMKGHQEPRLPLSPQAARPNRDHFRRLSRALTTPPRPSPSRYVIDEALAPAHQDPSTVSAVQSCVEQLKDLGFGGSKDGGVKRLVVYAQAADGDLGDAIDMIDEERKAYGERG